MVYALAFKRLRQEDQKFEVSLGYTLSLRPSWARGDLASEITPLSPDSYLSAVDSILLPSCLPADSGKQLRGESSTEAKGARQPYFCQHGQSKGSFL